MNPYTSASKNPLYFSLLNPLSFVTDGITFDFGNVWFAVISYFIMCVKKSIVKHPYKNYTVVHLLLMHI